MKKSVVIAFMVFLNLVLATPSFCQTLKDPLLAKKITLDLTDSSVDEVFRHLMYLSNVPIGVEGAPLDNDHHEYVFNPNIPDVANRRVDDPYVRAEKHPVTIVATNAPLESVLNDIVRQMKNYKWEVADGVVNIFPSDKRDPLLKEMLELKISRFSFGANSLEFLPVKVTGLPELKEFADKHDSQFSPLPLYNNNRMRKLETPMEFSDLTLKELLNKIAKSKRGGWMLRRNFSPRRLKNEELLLLI